MEAWRQGVVSGSTLVNASMLNSAGAIVPDAYQRGMPSGRAWRFPT